MWEIVQIFSYDGYHVGECGQLTCRGKRIVQFK